ncbi:MAG TPA: hypothetical protein VGE21_02645 [Flavobacteriales bacterium]
MACEGINSNHYIESCLSLISGVRKLHVVAYNQLSATTWTYDAEGRITGSTTSPSYYTIDLPTGLASFDEVGTFAANGYFKTITHSCEVVLLGQSQKNRNLANKLINGQWSMLVTLESGELVALGLNKPLVSVELNANPGVGDAEENAIRVKLSSKSGELMKLIDPNGTYTNPLFAA